MVRRKTQTAVGLSLFRRRLQSDGKVPYLDDATLLPDRIASVTSGVN